MRRILAILIVCMNSAFGFGQMAEFFVHKPTHKFPRTVEGAQLTHTFEVINNGDVPLIISDYDVSCKCTKADLPGPIAPGQFGLLTIYFDTNEKYGLQDRTVILHTNTKRKTEQVHFKVYVIPAKDS